MLQRGISPISPTRGAMCVEDWSLVSITTVRRRGVLHKVFFVSFVCECLTTCVLCILTRAQCQCAAPPPWSVAPPKNPTPSRRMAAAWARTARYDGEVHGSLMQGNESSRECPYPTPTPTSHLSFPLKQSLCERVSDPPQPPVIHNTRPHSMSTNISPDTPLLL